MVNQLDPQVLESWKDVFPNLTFDEPTHVYHVNGVVLPSVSTVVKHFYDEFDLENISKRYAKKHGFRVKDVKDCWKGNSEIASTRGTFVHEFSESYAKWKWYGIGKRPKVTCKQCLGALQFWESLPPHIYPVGLEVQMYSEYYGFTGTGDNFLINSLTGDYIWSDWKTNESLFSDYPQKPLKILPKELGLVQDNLGKYTVQLNLYRILMEDAGFPPTSGVITWLREQEDKKLYKNFKVQDIRSYLREFLETKKHTLEIYK